MEKQFSTPLALRVSRLPKFVDFEIDIKPELEKAGINQDTFEEDCEMQPASISFHRLEVYARIFNCKIDDLITFSKNPNGHH